MRDIFRYISTFSFIFSENKVNRLVEETAYKTTIETMLKITTKQFAVTEETISDLDQFSGELFEDLLAISDNIFMNEMTELMNEIDTFLENTGLQLADNEKPSERFQFIQQTIYAAIKNYIMMELRRARDEKAQTANLVH